MLQVFITNNIRIRGASVPLRSAVERALTMDNPEYIEKKKRKLPTWGISQRLEMFVREAGDIIAPRGFKQELLGILQQQGITPEKVITTRQTELAEGVARFGPWNPQYAIGAAPREYQREAVDAVLAQGGGVLVSPAGSGKTAMGLNIVHSWKQPALWLVHTIDLMNQAAEAAKKYMPEIGTVGMIGGGKKDWGSGSLIVATVDTLQANPGLVDTLNELIGAVVVDEAHHFPASKFIEVAGQFKARYFLGLTATPQRKDRLEQLMYWGIGPKCYEVQRDGMYDAGAIIKPDVRFIYTAFDYEQASDRTEWDSVDAGGEDLNYSALVQTLIADEARAKLVAENILEAAPYGPAIVITESVRYCYVLRDLVQRLAASRYRGMQLRMAVVHGGISKYTWHAVKGQPSFGKIEENGDIRYSKRLDRWEERVEQYTDQELAEWQVTPTQRKEILAACSRKEIDILFATQLAREGLDMPHLCIGHMAMPKRGDAQGTKNGASVEQEIGRIMRADPRNPEKKAIWYDYVDYNVGVFRDQYSSRRSVYKRLGLTLPRKPKTEAQKIEDFLTSTNLFDLPY